MAFSIRMDREESKFSGLLVALVRQEVGTFRRGGESRGFAGFRGWRRVVAPFGYELRRFVSWTMERCEASAPEGDTVERFGLGR